MKLHCPECKSENVKPISINGKNTVFGLFTYKEGSKLPVDTLHVNVIYCDDCGFTWLKFTDSQAQKIKELNKQFQIHCQIL